MGCPIPPKTQFDQLAEELATAVMGDDMEKADSIEQQIRDLEYPPRLGAAAEIYASWGWPVFPLRKHD